MFLDFLQNNYACLILCMLFLVFILTEKSFNQQTERLFIYTISTILCLVLVDNLGLIEAQKEAPTFLRRLYAAIAYTLRPTIAVMITLIMYRKMVSWKNRHLHTFLLPLILNGFLSFLSIWNGCVFVFSKDGTFSRGIFGYVPFITGAAYVLFMLAMTVLQIKVRRKGETLVIFMSAFLCIAGTLMDTAFKMQGIMNASCTIATVFYYLYLHVSTYSMDQLTQSYNRRIFYIDMQKRKRKDTVIVAMDLNDLKTLNDKKGHAAGDKALVTLAQTIHMNSRSDCTLYRMGGDEFLFLCSTGQVDEIKKMMKNIEDKMNETAYSFAYGIVIFQNGDDIDTICNRADEEMYKMKARMKATL